MTAVQVLTETAPFDKKTAQAEIQIAWENHKRDGLEFGKVCHEWTARAGKSKGGYGSAGQGLSEILNVLQIPRHIVDYWMGKYECSIGEGIPCPDCTKTFPSKSKLKTHRFKGGCVGAVKPKPSPTPDASISLEWLDAPTPKEIEENEPDEVDEPDEPSVKLTSESIKRDNLLPPGFEEFDPSKRFNHFQQEVVWHLHDGEPATGSRGNGMAVHR